MELLKTHNTIQAILYRNLYYEIECYVEVKSAKSTSVLCDTAKHCSQLIPQTPLPIEVAILRKRNLKNRTKFRITNLSTTAVAKFAIFHFRVASYDRFDILYNFHYKYLVLFQNYYMNLLLHDILYTILIYILVIPFT